MIQRRGETGKASLKEMSTRLTGFGASLTCWTGLEPSEDPRDELEGRDLGAARSLPSDADAVLDEVAALGERRPAA